MCDQQSLRAKIDPLLNEHHEKTGHRLDVVLVSDANNPAPQIQFRVPVVVCKCGSWAVSASSKYTEHDGAHDCLDCECTHTDAREIWMTGTVDREIFKEALIEGETEQ